MPCMHSESKGNAEVDMAMDVEGAKVASQDQGNALVDRYVKKGFGDFGEFIGKVVSYDSSSGYFKVFYEDEDKEDFELDELMEIMVPEGEVTDEMRAKFGKLKRKIFQKRDTCRRVASSGASSEPPKRSRRDKSTANEVDTPEPRKRTRREKSKVNENVSSGPNKRVRREKSNLNEVGSSELPKRARRENSKVNEFASSEVNSEVVVVDCMKPEPEEAAQNVDGKIRVEENLGAAQVEKDTRLLDSVVSKSNNEAKEGADNVDGKFRVAENSEGTEVGKDTTVLDSVAVAVDSKIKTESKEGADNADGKIRVTDILGGAVVEEDTKVPDSVADSKCKNELKEGADNVDGKIRVGEISGGAEVEKDTKFPDNNGDVDSKGKSESSTKRKTNIEAAASMAVESSMTVSSWEESIKSQRQKRRKVSQNVENAIKLDGYKAKEFTAPENLEMLTPPRRRRGRPKKDGVTQNDKKCSAKKEISNTAQTTTQQRRRGRPKKDEVTQNSQKCSAQKEVSGTPQTRNQRRRCGRPKNDDVTQNFQTCSAEKELSSTSQRRRKRMGKKNANGPGWSDSDDEKNSHNLEGSFTDGNEEVSLDVDASDCDDSDQVVLSRAIENQLPPVQPSPQSSGDIILSDSAVADLLYDQVVLSRAIENQLPPMQPLPQSSGDIILPDSAVADLLSVYTFLRASSDLLFLSPFTLEDFLGALNFRASNSLLDSVHVSLLRALRRHLEMLLTEGNNRASICLRQLDWDFLDAVTWPFYLAVYLLTQHGSKKLGGKIGNQNILDGEYYRIMASTKLTILQLLCDDVMETEEFRTKVNILIDFEHDIDDDEKMNMFSTPSAFNGINTYHNRSKQILFSEGDIQKSSHESINSISDNSTLQNRQGNSSNGEAEFTTVAMNDGEDFNSDECRLCGMDGGLLCCDSCPSAYHSRCVGMLKAHIPKGPWYCLECVVKKSDAVGLKALEALSGAEIFGIDPYGRVFFGTCGYLLVADLASNPSVMYRYYSKCDAKNIVEFLVTCGPFYNDIRSAILQYWGISDNKNDATCVQNSEHLVMQDEASRSGLPSGSIEGDGQLFDTGISYSNDNNITSTKGSPGVGPCTLTDLNVHKFNLDMTSGLSGQLQPVSISISMQEQVGLNANVGKGSHADACDSNLPLKIEQRNIVGKATDKVDSKASFWGSKSSFQLDAYRNHYALGDIAASAAAVLASMSAENNTLSNTRGVSKKRIQDQLDAISKVSGQFYWPSYNKKAMESPRERCGWCIQCKSSTTCRRACLLNVAASKVVGGAANVLGGIRPIKNGEGHLPAVAAYILYIEDCLHGLVVGPWENLNYRNHWRKCVEQASTVKEISASLLELEHNIRLIALAPSWTKHVEDPTSLVSVIHPATNVTIPTPRRGRRSHKNSVTSATTPAPINFRMTTIHWWRVGRLNNQVFQQGILPSATLKQAGRQGGLKRIPGVSYAEGSDIPIKSRQYIWRTAVEMATSLSQLAVQVRYLDAHVKWNDLEFLENHSQDVRATGKVAPPFPDATICGKKREGVDVQYLLDFGKQIDIPISVVKYGTRVEETQEGNNRYWLGEFHVPLYLLKAFEERLLQACQPNGYKQVLKSQNRVVQRSRKKHGFSVLFSEAEMEEKSSCVHCGGDLSMRKSVKCTSCAEIEGRSLEDYLGMALNPPRKRRSNQSGPVWRRNGSDELGREFRESYILLACHTENDVGASDGPKCLLCSQAYNPRLLYVGCTSCRAWFHGEAFRLNQDNIADLTGFKCYKCRKKSRPECPYETMDSKVRRDKLPVRRQPKVNRVQNHGLNVTNGNGKPLDMIQSNSGEALNGLWTVLDDEKKQIATTFEPDKKNAVYASPLKGNQEMHIAVKSEPDTKNTLHSNMLKDNENMHTGVKSETDFYDSSEVPPSDLDQSSLSHIFQHLELSIVGTEASSAQVEWNFPVMDWSQEDQAIEAAGGNLNPVEVYHPSEPLFTFTELLAGDHEQLEDLNESKGVVDNWTNFLHTGKEISMDSQTNGVESRACLSGHVMSSKTSDNQQDDKHDILMGFQPYGAASSLELDETQVPSMDNTIRSGEPLGECIVCGVADLHPHYQCNACGLPIHHHCYQAQQIGFWTTSGWICNSC